MRSVRLATAVALISSTAYAVRLEHADDGFSFDFAPRDARVCVLIPSAETSTDDCEGLPVDALRRQHAESLRVMVVRRPGEQYMLHFWVELQAPGRQWAQRVDRVARGWNPGAAMRPMFPDEEVLHRDVGGVEIVIRGWYIDDPSGGSRALVSYLVPGATRHHVLDVSGDETAVTRGRRDLDEALSTVTVRVSLFAKIWHARVYILSFIGFVVLWVTFVVYRTLRASRRA